MRPSSFQLIKQFAAKLAVQEPGEKQGKLFQRLIGSMTLLGVVSANSSGCAQVESPESATARYDRQQRDLISGIREKGVRDEKVLKALASVPRHAFVTDEFKQSSYDDNPLPIGEGQTISQPYIVAYMTEAISLQPQDKVLEIGTGSGYQACVLARLCAQVYSMEIIPELANRATKVLRVLGVDNVHVRTGDGYKGWPEEAPFDAIIVTAAPPSIPDRLVDQLKVGGRLVAPVGKDDMQWLVRLTKMPGGEIKKETLLPVRFVPMVPSSANDNG